MPRSELRGLALHCEMCGQRMKWQQPRISIFKTTTSVDVREAKNRLAVLCLDCYEPIKKVLKPLLVHPVQVEKVNWR